MRPMAPSRPTPQTSSAGSGREEHRSTPSDGVADRGDEIGDNRLGTEGLNCRCLVVLTHHPPNLVSLPRKQFGHSLADLSV